MGRVVGSNGKPVNNAVRFNHGLGDCVYYAFLAQLYLSRGIPMAVSCPDDKAWLFNSAGLRIEPGSTQYHPWHVPGRVEPTFTANWEGNKIAENINRPHPLPHIGSAADLWAELLAVRLDIRDKINATLSEDVRQWLRDMPRPIVLTHTRGRTCAESKNIDQYEAEMMASLVERGASVLHLDWDRASPDYRHPDIHDVCLKPCDLEKLACLIYNADLMIGIDSGPTHLARINYELPTLQVWTKHCPAAYALPRPHLVALTDALNPTGKWTPFKRHAYNIVDVEQLSGSIIANSALGMLEPQPLYLPEIYASRDIVLINQLAKMKRESMPYANTFQSFITFLSLIKMKSSAVELGGFTENGISSSYILGLYLDAVDGELHSVKQSEPQPFSCVNFIEGVERLEFLKQYGGTIHALVIGETSAEQALEEFRAALPRMAEDAAVMVAGCSYSERGEGFGGTGRLLVPSMIDGGWRLFADGEKCVLRR